ncbi:DNA replication licensing factor MCM2-like [Schistocerca gregaria]|uniref:DNA replication licensing factor MCM2-like n=1 Tax=Schistocerca gregaria TaxID=7010 RepID=UPI00211E28F6|nr:DNA replication licensing factor MCM2-like [Schistocerca gregaria]
MPLPPPQDAFRDGLDAQSLSSESEEGEEELNEGASEDEVEEEIDGYIGGEGELEGGVSSESEGEDIFDEDLVKKDYEKIPELDRYSSEDLSEGEYDPLGRAERLEVEKYLAERDKREGRGAAQSRAFARFGGLPMHLLSDLGLSRGGGGGVDELGELDEAGASSEEEGEDALEELGVEQVQGSLREYVSTVGRSAILRRFKRFLRVFRDEKGVLVYKQRINEMAKNNQSSLVVSWLHLSGGEQVPVLATWVVEVPTEMLQIFNEAAQSEVLREFPNYANICEQIFVRIADLPVCDRLRDLRQIHLNALIRVAGVVTRRSTVFSQLLFTYYDCQQCGFLLGPYAQESAAKEVRPIACSSCQAFGPFAMNMEKTVFRNYQRVTLQESPSAIPPGRLPRSKEVILVSDLVDSARPGDEVEITGVLQNRRDRYLNVKHGFPVFKTVIEANYVQKSEVGYDTVYVTEEEEKLFRRMSKDGAIGQRIAESIAPSIYGHLDVKMSLALALFGGEPKELEGSHRTRGDINVLLIGDPGTAKSQFLKYLKNTAHRSVYTTGQGASAVGLTAAVRKDPVTREFTLEGGALVLADRGMCIIDEFDKMNDKDRTSIHEAMEQQSISISKAGIVTTLQARCSVVAAANPIRGRYDVSLPFSKNVELLESILSRFDITCILRDVVDVQADRVLAQFVAESHQRSHPLRGSEECSPAAGGGGRGGDEFRSWEEGGPIPQGLLRKYIYYARKHVHPRITNQANVNKIMSVYVEMRREGRHGGVPMTVRHVESMLRMSEAHAKMHLREVCTDDDIDMAIRSMLNSFIQSQKWSVMHTLKKKFRKYLVYKKDHNEIMMALLAQIYNEHVLQYRMKHARLPPSLSIDSSELEMRAKEQFDVTDFSPFYCSEIFRNAGFKLSANRQTITKVPL